MSAMALVFAVAIVLAGAKESRFGRETLRIFARLVVALLLATVITAVAWLPAMVLLSTTARAQPFDAATAGVFSFHPLRLLEMVASNALGDPIRQYPAGNWIGEPEAGDLPLFYSAYLGIVSIALALFAMRRRRLSLVLVASAMIALLVAFGRHLPVHEIWRTILFPFARMRSPEKHIVLVVASVATLVGLGTSRLFDKVEGPRLRRLLVLGAVLAIALGLAQLLLPQAVASCVRAAVARSLLLLGLLVLLLWLCPRSWYLTRIGLLGLMALDLGVPAHHLAGFGDGKLLTSTPPAMETILQDDGHDPFPPRAFREPNVEMGVQLGGTPTWQDSQVRALRSLTPNAVNVFGLAVVPGYEAAFPDLTSQLGIRSYPAVGMVARLYAIRYALILDTGLTPLRTTAAASVLSEPLPGVKLVRLDDVLPRVYLSGQVRRLPHAKVARHLLDTAVVAGKQVLLSSTEGDALTGALAEPQACTVSRFTNTYVAVSCAASSPTMAVFVEQYDAGWSAVVDGQPAKIERANLFLRGVSLSAGVHRIEMHYRPPGLSLAASISAIGMLGLVAGMLRRRRVENGNSP